MEKLESDLYDAQKKIWKILPNREKCTSKKICVARLFYESLLVSMASHWWRQEFVISWMKMMKAQLFEKTTYK